MAHPLRETAGAKINLTLRVLGRRADGYHELDSLVAFADRGDELELVPGSQFELTTVGLYSRAIDGDNLVARAVAAVRAAAPSMLCGKVRLEKRLPVAAGIGGGSADAAAMLRLLQRSNSESLADVDWPRLALSLGADVPVCFVSRAAVMRGIGDIVVPVEPLPPVAVMLANPGIPLRTADVFKSLAAPAFASEQHAARSMPPFRDLADLIAYIETNPNDLEPVARRLCPEIVPLIARLSDLPGARLARMSGSGPTCFALFETLGEAEAAAAHMRHQTPEIWTLAARLR